jgi:hypothetical protein
MNGRYQPKTGSRRCDDNIKLGVDKTRRHGADQAEPNHRPKAGFSDYRTENSGSVKAAKFDDFNKCKLFEKKIIYRTVSCANK